MVIVVACHLRRELDPLVSHMVKDRQSALNNSGTTPAWHAGAVGSRIAVTVTNNADKHRFELRIGGALAHLDYRCAGGRLVLVHTEVPEMLSGRGLGSELVEAALDTAISRGLSVVPACSFARSFLRKHPELASRVKIQWPQE